MALTERNLTIPEIMLIAGTRAALGLGVGLLISDRLTKDQRKVGRMGARGSRHLEYDPDCDGRACEATGCRETSGVVNSKEPPRSERISTSG